MTDKEERALRRDVEAHHDAVEDDLAALKARYDEIEERLTPLLEEQRQIEAQMDALKAPLHGKRLELAGKLKAREEAK